jgi:hypothetical protein
MAALAVAGMCTAAIAEPMQGGPYSPSTEPYAACSRDGFSGVQGQNGWSYGYVPHGNTWDANMLPAITMFDWFDPGMGPSGTWRVQNPGENENLLLMDRLGQTKAGGAAAYNTVRMWESDTTLSATEVLGGVIDVSIHGGAGVRNWVKIHDVSTGVTTTLADNWGTTSGTNYYYYANQQIDPGDLVMFGIGHTGADQSSDGAIQEWHQHITPEPVSALLLLLGAPLFLRRKRR